MPIFYTDTASFNSLSVTGSTIMSASSNVTTLQLIGSGSTIFSVSGSSGSIFSITDAAASNTNLFSVSTGSIDIFTVDSLKNVRVSGSLIVTGSITGSLLGTASFATSASSAISSSFATTASFVTTAQTASFFSGTVTSASYASASTSASFASTASFVTTAQTASFVATASFASNTTLLNGTASAVFATTGSNTFIGNQIITGSLSITGSSINLTRNANAQTQLNITNTTAGTVSTTEINLNSSTGAGQLQKRAASTNVYKVLSPLDFAIYNTSGEISIFNDTAGGIKFTAGGQSTPHLYLSASGNFGINTTGPTAKLQVEGNSILNGNVTLGNNAINYDNTNAYLGIGVTSPTTPLHVVGQLRLASYTTTTSYAGTAVGVLAFDATGSILTIATPGGGSTFPYTGSAVITGSLVVTGSFDLGIAKFNSTSSATTAGTTIVSSINTGSATSAFYNYTIASASNARSGQVISVWNGSTVQYTELTTTDIGNTATASFAVGISGANVNLSVTAPGVWTVKSIVNLL